MVDASEVAAGTHSTSKQFTVGKLDAGMAILLTDDHHLIEFPSLLLPKGVVSGSIVNIAVGRNLGEEKKQRDGFWKVQETILSTYGTDSPEKPLLSVKSVTQTSVCLQWEPLRLAGSTLRSLTVFKDGNRLPLQIPHPQNNQPPQTLGGSGGSGSDSTTSTTTTATRPQKQAAKFHDMVRVSGLSVDHDYTFHIVMKTSAGVLESVPVPTRTHKMEDMTGIRVFFGAIDASTEDVEVEETIEEEVEEEVEEEAPEIPADRSADATTSPVHTSDEKTDVVNDDNEKINDAEREEKGDDAAQEGSELKEDVKDEEKNVLKAEESGKEEIEGDGGENQNEKEKIDGDKTEHDDLQKDDERADDRPDEITSPAEETRTDENSEAAESAADASQPTTAESLPTSPTRQPSTSPDEATDVVAAAVAVETETETETQQRPRPRIKKIVRKTVPKTIKTTKPTSRLEFFRSLLRDLGGAETKDGVTPETTHYLCDNATGSPDWEAAVRANLPTVKPDWLRACRANVGKKIPPTGDFYISTLSVPSHAGGGGGSAMTNAASASPSK